MATSENWVLDSVVQFLRSPTWTVPVMNFIEENCLVFDNDEENKLEYTEAHNQYKGMVEALLGSFMEDLGITEDQFTEGCKKELLSAQAGTYPLGLFQQLWAADNFLTFKAMMVQTRVELELQALHMLKSQNGLAPDEHPKVREAAGGPEEDDEEAILQEVLRKSKEEYEAQQKGKKSKPTSDIERVMQESKDELARMEELLKKEREMLEQAMKLSLECMPKVDGEEEKAAPQGKPAAVVAPASAPKKEAAKVSTPAKQSSLSDLPTARVAPVRPQKPQSPPPTQSLKPSAPPPGPPQRELSSSEAAAAWLKGAQAEAEHTSDSTGSAAAGPGDDELKRRQEHLRQQRDKLMAMKKKEREKQLQQYNQTNNRPKSSKVAEQVAAGKMESVQPTPSTEDSKKLQMRLTLAERLKQEVIGKK
ncbi:PREDICTED: cilia- and flagella-associated protein 36-like isoform X1 [Branchiostoma belcheri]|uniref:Cilia- and flagella-associated protein 36 n=1 Tax=Branchiostoma belcheri TaxID=7741 RepID=A0A6P5AC91_BRABE|nr:PREDICTED: cilia- and flagella-associated protein 36-like isoform X1 [Branchiostoma belcheri]